MAVDTLAVPSVNGTSDESAPIQLAIDLPHSLGTCVNLHLTNQPGSILLFLASSSPESGNIAASMGSLVYAMPDRYNPTQPMSTTLYSIPASLDFATRIARLLARRTKKPCYVGSSLNLSGTAAGGTVEEELGAFRSVTDAVLAAVLH